MKILFILAILVCSTLALNGCVPLLIGGFMGYEIGTQMAETHAHDEWCAQHIGDVACHP